MAVRLEPIILELERDKNDLLIIAHESVLRVLYGYLMACNAADIPFLSFPRDEIIEVLPLFRCVVDQALTFPSRSSLRATTTKPSGSKSPTCHPISFPLHQKALSIQLRRAALRLPFLACGVVWPVQEQAQARRSLDLVPRHLKIPRTCR